MKEFIKKLIERLEENQNIVMHFNGEPPRQTIDFPKAIEIVNQVAEEYGDMPISAYGLSLIEAMVEEIENLYGRTTELSERARDYLEKGNNGWIPCSERLPRDFEYVYATCVSLIDNREPWVIEGIYHSAQGWDVMTPMLGWGDAKVIAWMKKEIPAPYQQKGE